jgi:N-acetylglucosamine-6-phosphate deacetylase
MKALPIPGFVDLQVNGYKGIDFSRPDLTEEAFLQACENLFEAGTSAFLPTMITSPLKVYEHNLPIIVSVMARPAYRDRLLGIHLEGPFISPKPGVVGAHNPDWVLPPDITTFQQINTWARHTIRMLTLAAELSGADQLTRYAAGQGIVVSSGHSMATPADLDRLAQAGAVALTHLGNGLPYHLPKYNNPLWAGLADDRYIAMMIGDGHHIPNEVLKVMIRAKGIARTIIVSDASPIAGLPPGRYTTLGNDVILEESGLLHNPHKGFLVGSSATMLVCMNHLASLGLFSLDELLDLGFYNPLRLIGIQPSAIPSGIVLQYEPNIQKFQALSDGV